MIHIFNRKELITVQSDQRAYRLQEALDSAGIDYRTKAGGSFFTAGRYHGAPGISADAAHPCVFYVKAADYERAKAAIQAAL